MFKSIKTAYLTATAFLALLQRKCDKKMSRLEAAIKILEEGTVFVSEERWSELIGCHVSFRRNKRHLLGNVAAINHNNNTIRLLCRHFNGEAWPIMPNLDEVEVLNPPSWYEIWKAVQ